MTRSSTRVRTPRAQRASRSNARRLEPILAAVLLAAFAQWTWLVLSDRVRWLDDALRPPHLDPRSVLGQIGEAFSLLTHPLVILVAIGLVAVFSFRQRMRRLAVALAIAAAGIPAQVLLAWWIRRPRAGAAFADSLSALGPAYPNGHAVGLTLGAWMLVTLTRAHRRPSSDIAGWWMAGIAAIALACLAQWSMGLARPSDLVGGLLLGGGIANAALSIGGVESILSGWARLGLPRGSVDKRAAVILNPTKFDDLSLLRRRVEAEVLTAGWHPTTWLETTADDPGHEPTKRALALGVDLIMVAGGDGTVRAVSAELAGSDVPMALLPSGTGNLLARNLGVPLDIDSALELALEGIPQAIDVVHCRTEGPASTPDTGDAEDADGAASATQTTEERFVVMAGMGLDAQIMEDTNDDLKRVIRAGAYALAAVQNAVPDPFTATVTLDDDEPIERDVVMALLGNVGTITGGMTLFPQASPSDGRLDLMLASPERVADWAKLGAQILTGKDMEGFETLSASRVRIEADRPIPFELDGDTAGTVRVLDATVEPGALLVVAPGTGSATRRE